MDATAEMMALLAVTVRALQANHGQPIDMEMEEFLSLCQQNVKIIPMTNVDKKQVIRVQLK